jgi:hypothetical protein
MSLRARTVFAITVVCVTPCAAEAQAAAAQDPDEPALEALALALAVAPLPPQPDSGRADALDAVKEPRVDLVVTFAARSLVFDEVPRIRMAFGGSEPRRAVWKVERTNLPARVERGVEYRDVKVKLTLSSTVDEFEALIEDARRVASGIRSEKATP